MYMIKYTIDEIFSSGGATLYKNPSDQTVYTLFSDGGAYNPSRCQGLEVVDSKYFYPFPWFEASSAISQKKSLEEWEDFFKDSYSADFFATSVMGTSKTRVQRANFYGKQKPAFVYLGPKYCPTSYFSAKLF